MSILIPHTAFEFKKNELETLRIISEAGFFYSDFGELGAALYQAYSRYVGVKKKFDFVFVSDFDMEIEKKNHRVVLHGEVLGDYDFSSYSVGVCEEGTSRQLIRRFHFDYIHNKAGTEQRHPRSHLQYGGKSGNGLDDRKFHTDNIAHWLSEPRISSPPINIALLLDLVFCEFFTEKTKKIVENPDWRSLIKDNEEFIFGHYYRTISQHIGSPRHNKDRLVRDICYDSSTN